MVEIVSLTSQEMAALAEDVSRSLARARVAGSTMFVTTAVTYTNGTSVVVRIDQDRAGFTVSDGGRGALAADLMGAITSFNRIVSDVASGAGVSFADRSFFLSGCPTGNLPTAIILVANASAQAVQRTAFAVERAKLKRSKQVFEARLSEAFGPRISFNASIRGLTTEWEFDGVLAADRRVAAVFEFVSPKMSAVATAHMKLGDVRNLTDPPRTVAALSDYDETAPALRSILSAAADKVIPVGSDVSLYEQAA